MQSADAEQLATRPPTPTAMLLMSVAQQSQPMPPLHARAGIMDGMSCAGRAKFGASNEGTRLARGPLAIKIRHQAFRLRRFAAAMDRSAWLHSGFDFDDGRLGGPPGSGACDRPLAMILLSDRSLRCRPRAEDSRSAIRPVNEPRRSLAVLRSTAAAVADPPYTVEGHRMHAWIQLRWLGVSNRTIRPVSYPSSTWV
ncbi:hypothetical protein FA95DRAFT_1024915 [Auriscalpium vulgare]|uniref:Uncharacterized protein n=1 Tax=Auriscalpium vulgare TaxID=40419 RepID=A0ACB8RXU7_9AGAM|nr:hypothetical protein FA95DRAFT_1024915 [Auriscalpium vulgare]